MKTIPATIGKYPVSRMLGSGGMGRVYLGVDPDIGREVAIKVIHLDHRVGDGAHERFLQEARTMGRLNHPNIVTLLEFGVEGDSPYLVLELLHGMDLSEWLKRPHRLGSYLQVMRDMAAAIGAAHQAGVLHRDIKPDNIRVLADDHCKLLDFGIADGLQDNHLTGTGAFVGTAEYIAPEVVAGQRHSAQSDIYSLGLLFYQMLAGFNPFRADNVASTLARILQVEPIALSLVRDGIPPALATLIFACLKKDPTLRPGSAGQLIDVLDQCLRTIDPQTQLGPVRVAGPAQGNEPPGQFATAIFQSAATPARRVAWWLGASAGLVLLAASGGWWWLHRASTLRVLATDGAVTSPAVEEPAIRSPAVPGRPADQESAGIPDSAAFANPVPPASDTAAMSAPQAQPVLDSLGTGELGTGHPEQATAAPLEHPVTRPQQRPTGKAASPPATVERSPVAPVLNPPSDPLSTAATAPQPSAQVEPAVPQAAPSTTPPAAALAVPVAPLIESGSTRYLSRGRTTYLVLSGAHFSDVSSAWVRLGMNADPRFEITDITIDGDTQLSLRIKTARNLPLGRYGLVLQSANAVSAPFILEVSL